METSRTGAVAGGQSELANVASTLVIAALFQPARRRIQNTVDRRFYRQWYDAKRTLGAFSARLRAEIELDTLNAELLSVVQATMQPARSSITPRKPGDFGQNRTGFRWSTSLFPHPRWSERAMRSAWLRISGLGWPRASDASPP